MPTLAEAALWLLPVAYFVVYATFGWILEVAFVAVTEGTITNRGFLAGPFCPIYGAGAVGILYLTTPIADNAALIFVASAVIGSALELVTGWGLEKLFGQRWWDYSDKPFNLGGYVCLSYSLGWGVVGLLFLRVLHPAVADVVAWLPDGVVVTGTLLLVVGMLGDAGVTVAAVLHLNRQLGVLQEANDAVRRSTDALSERVGEGAQRAKADADELRARLVAGSATTRRHLAGFPRRRALAFPEELAQLQAEFRERRARRGASTKSV